MADNSNIIDYISLFALICAVKDVIIWDSDVHDYYFPRIFIYYDNLSHVMFDHKASKNRIIPVESIFFHNWKAHFSYLDDHILRPSQLHAMSLYIISRRL